LVLTPHTYLMGGAATFTDTLFLNAQGNSSAVFVIQINGALTTSTYSKVILINGAQSKNVYWKIEGAVTINNYSTFCGTIICNNGALGAINTGVILDGRALTTTGALTTTAINDVANMIPTDCATLGIQSINADKTVVTIYPNPFSITTNIHIDDALPLNNCELKIYNMLGETVLNKDISQHTTAITMNKIPDGIYFYQVLSNDKIIQSGKLISQQ